MAKVPIVAETISPARLILNTENVGLTPEQFFRLCGDNPELRLELTAQKEIIIMPPAGSESGGTNFNIAAQLAEWIKRDRTGKGFDSSAGFTLPNAPSGLRTSPGSAGTGGKLSQSTNERSLRRSAPTSLWKSAQRRTSCAN